MTKKPIKYCVLVREPARTEFMDQAEILEITGWSHPTLGRYLGFPGAPMRHKRRGKNYYRRDAVRAWLSSGVINGGEE